MLKQTLTNILILTLSITPLYAEEQPTPEYLKSISSELKEKIESVSARQSGGTQRPQSCPLESKLHLDLLTKVQNIKSLFTDSCLDNDQSVITDILEGAESIQNEINSIGQTEESDSSEEATETETSEENGAPTGTFDIGGVELDGKTVADVLTNINDIYKKNSCRKLSDNKSFLASTADIILDIAKIGLLVPNTTVLTVAGGGVALSSTLNILNNIFTKRFDFEETEDRQTFIKLNCAFYDIRRDIEKSGFLDISTEDHQKDHAITKELLKEIEQQFKSFNKAFEAYTKKVSEDEKEFYQVESGHLHELIEDLENVKIEINKEITLPSQKLALIELLTRISPIAQKRLQTYIDTTDDELNFLNLQFMVLLKKFDYTNVEAIVELQTMDLAQFMNTIQETIKYHVNRLDNTYAEMQKEIAKKWKKTPYKSHKSAEEFLSILGKEKLQKEKEYEKLYLALNNVDARLKRIIDEVPFTSSDDGTENVVSILSEFDSIVDRIYGKHGEKFLDYTTKKSLKLNKTFKKNFDEFAESHLEQIPGGLKIKSKDDLTQLRLMYACQDARPFRRQWKLAESLSQQGYDFVATNADLFHSDINRIWLGRSGNRRFGIHRILSRYERIQMHHKSAIYAKKKISGIPFDRKYERKYLRKKFLGRSIIEVTESKKKAMILQELIEIYDCPLRTIMP